MSTIGRIRTAMVAVLVAVIVPLSSVSASCGSGMLAHHPISLSLFPPISTNGSQSGDVSTNFSLNILGGYVGELRGLELGTLFNVEAYDASWLQLAGGVNVVGVGSSCGGREGCGCSSGPRQWGDFTGLQLAGLGNIVMGDARGVQLAAVNIVKGEASSVQLGVGNYGGNWATIQLGGANLSWGGAGFQLGAVDFAREEVVAAQIGGVNIAGGDVPVQLGVLNATGGNAAAQFGGINAARHNTNFTLGGVNFGGGDNEVALGGINFVRGSSKLQFGGINVLGNQDEAATVSDYGCLQYGDRAEAKSSGLQVGVLNGAGGSTGAQIGAINIADQVRAFQFGAFNFARENDIAIGPLNVILNGQFRVHVFASEAPLAGFELKTGGRYFYNVLSFGYHPTDTARVMLGYGVGGHFPCVCPKFFVDADLVGYRVNPMDDMMNMDGMSYLAKVRATAGWEIAPRFSITGGLAANVWISDKEDGASVPFLSVIPMYKMTGSTNIAVWPGASVGLEFRVI